MKKIKSSKNKKGIIAIDDPLKKKHYQEKRKIIFFRLALTYLLPTLLMIGFFANEYYSMINESTEKRLLTIAESQAKILDVFINWVNMIKIWADFITKFQFGILLNLSNSYSVSSFRIIHIK
jgi:hypothetical protein